MESFHLPNNCTLAFNLEYFIYQNEKQFVCAGFEHQTEWSYILFPIFYHFFQLFLTMLPCDVWDILNAELPSSKDWHIVIWSGSCLILGSSWPLDNLYRIVHRLCTLFTTILFGTIYYLYPTLFYCFSHFFNFNYQHLILFTTYISFISDFYNYLPLIHEFHRIWLTPNNENKQGWADVPAS